MGQDLYSFVARSFMEPALPIITNQKVCVCVVRLPGLLADPAAEMAQGRVPFGINQ